MRTSTRKCVRLQLAVEKTADFGVTVIGETLRRCVRVRNAGALGTAFTFTKLLLASASATAAGARAPHSALARGGAGGASARSQRSVRIRDDALVGVPHNSQAHYGLRSNAHYSRNVEL